MTGFVGTSGGNKELSGLWVGTPSGNKEIMTAYVGTSTGNKIWYQKVLPIDLITAVSGISQINLSWTGGLGPFTLKRGSTVIYTGPNTSYIDTALTHSTAYTYTITDSIGTVDTATATTGAAPSFVVNASAANIQQMNVSWSNLGAGWTYTISASPGGTLATATTATSLTQSGLGPSTSVTYTGYAYYGGALQRTATKVASTPALPAFSMSAQATAWNNIYTSWTNLGAGWTYWLDTSGGAIGWVAGTAYNHGVGESSGYNYAVYAHYNGTHYLTAGASASTPARPKSYGTAYSNVGWESWGGWTGSTQRVLGGPNIYVGVGGTFTNMHALVYSHGDVNFRGEPRINGVAGPQQVYRVGRSHTNWPFNLGFGAGTFTTQMVVGGTNWGQAEWSPWSGQRWDYYLQVNHLDYWFYASLEREAEMRREPWWDERLAGRESLYIETWSNEEGTATVKARITDSNTSEILVEWERGD